MKHRTDFVDRPYLIYRHTAFGPVLYDTQTTQEAADASVLTGTGAHPSERFEIIQRTPWREIAANATDG